MRRRLRHAGVLLSVAGLSSSIAAQSPRTGWEGVKPVGWPTQAAAPAAPTRNSPPSQSAEVARAAEPVRTATRRSRRRSRHTRQHRPSHPVWITLEWDVPPPIDVVLDWSKPLLAGRFRTLLVAAPIVPRPALSTPSVDLADAPALSDQARLPVASVIHPSAQAPSGPRPIRVHIATPARGFRAWVNRLSDRLGLRTQPGAEASRLARADAGSVQ